MRDLKFEAHRLEENNKPIIYHYDFADEKEPQGENWHPNVECLLFTEGEGYVIYGDERFPVKPGDLCVINSNLLHSVHAENGVYYHCLIVDTAFAYRGSLDVSRLRFQSVLRDAEANEKYLRVVREFQGEEPFRDAAVRIAVLEFLLYLARNYAQPLQEAGRVPLSSEEGVRLAIGYIHAHIEETFNLDRVAKAVGFSKYHLIRVFSKTTGQTPMQYIGKARCERALALLKGGHCTVKSVADRLGFSDVSCFSKFFKKHMGRNPSEYLAEVQKKKISMILQAEGNNV